MADLNEQIHIEDHTLGMTQEEKDAGPPAPGEVVSPQETFSYFAHMYIKYLQIFKRLEESYDNMVHPQKRIDVKDVLETTMTRLVQLRHMLVYDERERHRGARSEREARARERAAGREERERKRACVWAFESVRVCGREVGETGGPATRTCCVPAQRCGCRMANTQTCSRSPPTLPYHHTPHPIPCHITRYWNCPLNPDVDDHEGKPFPWEYVHMDDLLVDLKLPPETLEVPVPHYFVDDAENKARLKKRDKNIKVRRARGGCAVVVMVVVVVVVVAVVAVVAWFCLPTFADLLCVTAIRLASVSDTHPHPHPHPHSSLRPGRCGRSILTRWKRSL